MVDPKYTMQVPENTPQWLVNQQLTRIAEEMGCDPSEIAVESWGTTKPTPPADA
jgi:hypothetical protein